MAVCVHVLTSVAGLTGRHRRLQEGRDEAVVWPLVDDKR